MSSKLKVYNIEGKVLEEKKLDQKVFDLAFLPELVHNMLVLQQANARSPIAHTKGRSDVRWGGKKPRRQKGTGRARQGTRRAPNFVGWGIVFGPTNQRNFSKNMPKKMRKKALYSLISRRAAENMLIGLNTSWFGEVATKKVVDFFKKTELMARKNVLVVYAADSSNEFLLSSRNIANVSIVRVEYLNVFSLIKADCVIFVDWTEGKIN